MNPTLPQILAIVTPVLMLCGFLLALHQYRQNNLSTAFAKIEAMVKTQGEKHDKDLREQGEKHDKSVSDLRTFIHAFERDVGNDFVRRDDYERSLKNTEISLQRLEAMTQKAVDGILEVNRHLRKG